MEELKNWLKEKIAESTETADGFYPGEVDAYDIGSVDGAIDAYNNVLTWIERKEK